MIWTLALVGALVGASFMHHAGGTAVGAMLGYLLGRVLKLDTDLQALREDLRIQREINTATSAKTKAPEAPTEKVEPLQVVPPPSWSVAAEQPQEPISRPTAQPPPIPRTPAAAPVLAPESPSLLSSAVDWIRGGNPLARVGIVILFFGGAFLAKYAAEHSYFPIGLRMVALAIGALVLLAVGWGLRNTRAVYAQTLQGGGIAGLYLTIFAATRLYDLLLPSAALALLVLIAVVAAVLAVAQNALALAVFGTAGGFMAPVLLSTGSSNHIALFSYYTILNLGVFAIAWFRAWRVLNLVGFIFTFGIVGAFRATSYSPEKLLSADGFLLLFFLLYISITILFALRQKPDLKSYVSGSLVFGLPLATFAIHGSMIDSYQYGLAWSALGFGLFYFLLAGALHLTRRENFSLLSEAFAALGVIFGSLAIPLAFDHQTTAASWAVEGAGLLWIGMRQQRWMARAFGVLLQALGGAAFLLDINYEVLGPAVFNRLTIGCAMLAIAGVLSGYWLQRNRETARSWEAGWSVIATLWGLAWWFYGGFSEIVRTLPQYERGANLILLTITVQLLWLYGSRLRWPFARQLTVALLPAAACIGILSGPEHPFIQGAAIAWPVLFVIHYLLIYFSDADEDATTQRLLPWQHAAAFWLLAVVSAWELHWQLDLQMYGVWSVLPWGLTPALLLFLCARASDWPGWPLKSHAKVYQELVAPPLALWAAFWLAGTNLNSDGNSGNLIYMPLLNPLDIASVLILLCIALWWKQLSPEAKFRRQMGESLWPRAVFAGLVFVWLNAALIRALHYSMGTPLTFDGISNSIIVQAALSIFWGLLGFIAMIWSARRSQREVWMVGAALMAVVVIKLFVIDTSGSGTLARIVAFLSVGALLLLTGYLSPLPPRRAEEEAPEQ
ncbi:MAG: DUF2339 domain-containing protein [Pseudomonadota bacterium]